MAVVVHMHMMVEMWMEVGWVLVRMGMREGMHPMCIGRMLMKNCVCELLFPDPKLFHAPFHVMFPLNPFLCHSSPLPRVISSLVLVRMRMREGMRPKRMGMLLLGNYVVWVRMGWRDKLPWYWAALS